MVFASDIIRQLREIEEQNPRGYCDALEEILSEISRDWQPETFTRLALRAAKMNWYRYEITFAAARAMIIELS